jgi:hypothetical protein
MESIVYVIEAVISLAFASWLAMRMAEEIFKPIWTKLNLDLFYFKYLAMVVGFVFGWFTGLNAFSVFPVEVSVLFGRVISCVAVGLGPNFLYDILDQPKPPSD